MRMLPLFLVPLVCLASLTAVWAEPPTLESDEDKTLYTLGLAMSRHLVQFEFSEAEWAKIQAGLADGTLAREPRVSMQEFGPRVDEVLRARMETITERRAIAGAALRAETAAEPGAETTDSGLIYRELEPGDGASPAATDSVKIHYQGTLSDGTVFDSSLEKEPVTFALGGVIGCFRQGLQKMKVGGKSKLTCPPEIAYGDRGSAPNIGPGATLVFEVQLLEIVAQPDSSPAVP